MRGHLATRLLCVWLLAHPFYSDSSAWPVTKLWQSIWYRNTWIAVVGYDNKDACTAELKKSMAFAVTEMKKDPQGERRAENLAWSQVRCIPADAVNVMPFSIQASPHFGLL